MVPLFPQVSEPPFVPWGSLGATGSKPNQEFFQVGPICKGGGPWGALREDRGVGKERGFEGMEGMRREEREERPPTGRSRQGIQGSEGAEDNSPILFRRRAVSLVGADGSLGPQPGGSSGQLAYRRSLVLVSRFESSLRPWPPSAPPAPGLSSLATSGRGEQKQGPLSAPLPLPLGSARLHGAYVVSNRSSFLWATD